MRTRLPVLAARHRLRHIVVVGLGTNGDITAEQMRQLRRDIGSGHDLVLMPLYTLADRSAMAVFRHRPPRLPAVPWLNYLRVPAALSGMLLLIWFPLIFRLPGRFTATTTLSLDPFLWHWLAVTGALFLLSATALAVRLRMGHARRKTRRPSRRRDG